MPYFLILAIAFCPKSGTLSDAVFCIPVQFSGMFSESVIFVVTLQGGITVAACILLVIALCVCVRLYLLLRKAAVAREELIAANKNMEVAIRAKSEFLVGMSHEIRTPMNALTSFTEILTQRIAQNSTAELKEETEGILDIIKKSSRDLLTIINDVFDYIKIDANLLNIESVPVSIKQVIHDICHVEKPSVIAKHLDLSIKYGSGIPPVILSDPMRIRQILSSLIDNAVKFTDKGTITVLCEMLNSNDSAAATIKTSVSAKEMEESDHEDVFSASSMLLKISVIDTGVGLSHAQIQALFKPFRYSDSAAARHSRGTGLGLSIAMRLATLMDGTIHVESTLGQGSTFSLLLHVYVPQGSYANAVLAERGNQKSSEHNGSQLLSGLDIRIPKTHTEKVHSDKGKPLQNARILIVEDMAVNQAILSTLLRDAGAQVAIADNGAMGVQKVMQDMDNGLVFDVVLMDMQMPVMDGYEATSFLRKHGYRRPIIAVTAHALSGDREKTFEAGCDDYLAKPIDNKTLLAVISKYVV